MSFMQNMKQMLNEEYNTALTENGAIAYKTSGKALLDLNFRVSSFRNESEETIVNAFVKAYYENPELALRWMFFAGDIREGLGERRLFKTLFLYLTQNHREIAKALMLLIPEYSRWDIVVELINTTLAEEAVAMIQKQLKEDHIHMEQGKSISLCAKWLPSENASSKEKKRFASILAKKLSMTKKQYRQTLSVYRKYLNLVEIMMSSRKWAEIDYEKVPSRANLIYNHAFLRNDEYRRRAFLEAVKKGEKKLHAAVLYPHDIVHNYFQRSVWTERLLPKDDALEELWKALPDYVQENGNTLCVADGSGSMVSPIGKTTITCLEVADALAIYFAEHCRGQFHNCYITFSQNPQFVDLSNGKTLHDKIEITLNYHKAENTNIQAVFNLILDTAVKNHMTKEELPKNILILSDMEFDMATRVNRNNQLVFPNKKLFHVIAKEYEQKGYQLPRLIFWNICSRTNTIPVKENDLGVALVSGFSPTIMKMVLSNEIDPYKLLINQLMKPRYDAIGLALKSIEI